MQLNLPHGWTWPATCNFAWTNIHQKLHPKQSTHGHYFLANILGVAIICYQHNMRTIYETNHFARTCSNHVVDVATFIFCLHPTFYSSTENTAGFRRMTCWFLMVSYGSNHPGITTNCNGWINLPRSIVSPWAFQIGGLDDFIQGWTERSDTKLEMIAFFCVDVNIYIFIFVCKYNEYIDMISYICLNWYDMIDNQIT